MHNIIKQIFYLLIGLIPKNKNKIVFESHPDLTDNSKALYDYLNKNRKNKYKYIWVVENPKCYKKQKDTIYININKPFSLKYIYHVASSKYIMFCNREIRWVNLNKQIVISLTHGLPFKKSQGLMPKDHTFNYLLSSSSFVTKYMAKEYETSEEKCIVTGLPRNDYLFDKRKNELDLVKSYNKFIIWLPTYKKHNKVNILDSEKYKETAIPLLNEKDIKELNEYLQKENVLLILKFHPAQDLSFLKETSLSNIYLWKNSDLVNNNYDLYHLMSVSDALITDYSSVFLDYLLINKPIAFVIDDYEDFKTSRGFCVEDYKKMCQGPKIKTKKDFYNFIYDIIKEKDEYKIKRNEIKDLYHKYQNGESCKNLIDYFKL